MSQNFKTLMLDRRLVLFDWPLPVDEEMGHSAHIEELLELQQEIVSKYIIKVEAPKIEGKYDDYSDAIVRMVWCATSNSSKVALLSGSRKTSVTPHHAGKGRFGRTPKLGRKKGVGSHSSRMVAKKGR